MKRIFSSLILVLFLLPCAHSQTREPSQTLVPLYQNNKLFGTWSRDCLNMENYSKIDDPALRGDNTIVFRVFQKNEETYYMLLIDAKQVSPNEVSFVRDVYKSIRDSSDPVLLQMNLS